MKRELYNRAQFLALVFGLLVMTEFAHPAVAATPEEEVAYTKTITDRADRIVAPLGLDDAAKATRVRDLIVNQYRGLNAIHTALEAKIAEVKGPADPAVAEAWKSLAKKEASLATFPLHRQFVARLEAELLPEQVNQVKDGLTYGVVPITYKRYRELLPDLTVEQQNEILANLLEAREYAMDAGSSEEKHAWFGKYKGRINNFLSKAGIDMKQAEKDLAEREKAAQ